jgi:hypothetical protein
MTIDTGLKPEGAPERSPIAGAGAPSGVDAPGNAALRLERLARHSRNRRGPAPVLDDNTLQARRVGRPPSAVPFSYRLQLIKQQFEPIELAADVGLEMRRQGTAITRRQLVEPLAPIAAQRFVTDYAL